MEWDCAGFGITREDIKRMKQWSPNAIRLAVMDTLWTSGKRADGTSACTSDPTAYQREVKRVINWILQEGMDVIFDLHYVAGSSSPSGLPTTDNTTFWTKIAADSFFDDNRIIFELFNEPNGDSATIRNWMQTTVTAIRNAGNTNLILVSGTDWTYNLSYYASSTTNLVTGGAIAYVTHPYSFKDSNSTAAYLTPASKFPVIATEFGNANVSTNYVAPTTCDATIYENYITNTFEKNNMSWTSWAWIVDEWGCGFPQLLNDYSGTPNTIGTPVRTHLIALP
jgi:hypothetical protein